MYKSFYKMEFIIKEKKSERLEISGEDQRSREISRRWEVGRERREIRPSEREREFQSMP